MIKWSDSAYKVTLGIGALWMTALLGEICHEKIPVWVVIVITMLPLVVFLFVWPDEMSHSIVLPLQVFASLWYLLLSAILAILFFWRGETLRGWPIFFIGIFLGCIPCLAVLWKVLSREIMGRSEDARRSVEERGPMTNDE